MRRHRGSRAHGRRMAGLLLASGLAAGLGGCGLQDLTTGSLASATPAGTPKVVSAPTVADRECLARAMYFESNRSSEDGMLAVGTVVMNRLDSPKYPGSICGVVGQHRQFANGVLTRPVRDQDRARIEKVADLILSGERHSGVGPAMHFHTTGYSFPYTNMHYVADAGGNSFYEKSDREGYLPAILPQAVVRVAGGNLVPVKMAGLSDGPDAFSTGVPGPQLRAIEATQLAYGPSLPAGVPTRFTSAPGH